MAGDGVNGSFAFAIFRPTKSGKDSVKWAKGWDQGK